jgi:hypothetical protein
MSNTDLPKISLRRRSALLAAARVILVVGALIAGAILGFR